MCCLSPPGANRSSIEDLESTISTLKSELADHEAEIKDTKTQMTRASEATAETGGLLQGSPLGLKTRYLDFRGCLRHFWTFRLVFYTL